MTTEPTPERETKRYDQLHPGDITIETDVLDGDVFRQVRYVEPIIGERARVLVLYAGGHTDNARGAGEVWLATREEYAEFEAKIRDNEKRAAMRAGLQRLLDLIDDGLPLPLYFSIDASCMPDADSVRAVAEALDKDATESLNAGRPQWDVKAVLAESPGKYGRELVEFRAWHLAAKAVES